MKSIASNRYLIATKGAGRWLVPLEVLAVPFHVPTRKIDALRFFSLSNIQVLVNTTMLLLLRRSALWYELRRRRNDFRSTSV